MQSVPSVHVTPVNALVDDVIHVSVRNLPSNCDVTIAGLLVENQKVFVSHGHYKTDDGGEIDMNVAASSGGTFQGVEPMGLLWSMTPAEGQMKGLRLIKQDVSSPFNLDIFALDGHLDVTKQQHITDAKRVYASCRIYRNYQAEGVRAVPVRDGTVRGMLFLPPGDGPFPGVIDMFGTAGGLIQFRSALLASRGFAALALPFFDYEDLPPSLDSLTLDYFEDAANWLYNHKSVMKTSGGIGVVGVSKGASLALHMATYIDKVKAVVAINGAAIHYTGHHTYRGIEQPVYSPPHEHLLPNLKMTDEGLCFGEAFAPSEENEFAAIPLEKSGNAQLLLVFGEDDPSNVLRHLTAMVTRLQQHGLSNYRVLSYPGAGHLIEPPYSPHCRVAYAKIVGMPVVYGGETRAHSLAQEQSWAEMLSFLRKELNPNHSQKSNNDLSNFSDRSKL